MCGRIWVFVGSSEGGGVWGMDGPHRGGAEPYVRSTIFGYGTTILIYIQKSCLILRIFLSEPLYGGPWVGRVLTSVRCAIADRCYLI